MRNRIRFTGVRNLIIITVVFVLLLFAADRLIPVFSVQPNPEEYNDDVDFARLEKTPVESFLTVKEARTLCEENDIDISGYEINAYPAIDDMPSAEDKNGAVRIVVFGDSFVWGDNSINRNELFWRQTEQMLRAKGYNCSVTAVAMAGATAYEEIEWYENYLKENSADLVVFGYVFNDPIIDSDNTGEEEEFEYADFIPALKPAQLLFPNIYESISNYITAKTLYSGKYEDKMGAINNGVLKGKVRDYYKENFADRLDGITKETGIPSVVMALPVVPGSTMYKALFEPLNDIYSETTVKFYDPYVEFDKFYSLKHKKNLFVNPVNNHPGSATHYFYALYLTEMLERDFADVLGEKSEESLLSGIININECTPCGVDLELVEQTQGNVRYKFCYPEEGTRRYLFTKTERYCLNYPLGKGYIKLSFENPADIKDVELSGAPSGKTEIYYTKVNEKLGYDDNTLYPVSLTENDGCFSGTPNKTKITSICIHIDDGAYPDGKLELTINS